MELTADKYFYACDGSIIRSKEELFLELQNMPNTVFASHVNSDKNDFYNWIKDVFQDHYLAKNIKDAQCKDDILRHVFVSLFR